MNDHDPHAITPEDVAAGIVGDAITPVHTYARYGILDANGEPIPVGDPNPIQLDVWRRMLDPATREPTGFIKRERMRTLGEVFKDLDLRLDFLFCEKCGHEMTRPEDYSYGEKCPVKKCKGDMTSFIDEYFSGPDAPREPVPHRMAWVCCYPVTGGSEGHYVHVDFLCRVEQVKVRNPDPNAPYRSFHVLAKVPTPATFGEPVLLSHVRLALGKTFRGWDHACAIANRCARLLGA